MTSMQRQRIEFLRGRGESYAAIAHTLDISENTIKSFCRRNGLGASYIEDHQPVKVDEVCANCGRLLMHTPGAKRKRFCSDKCRMAWWAKHPEAVKRKAVYHFICPACGTEFKAYGNAKRKYCSRACASSARRPCHD